MILSTVIVSALAAYLVSAEADHLGHPHGGAGAGLHGGAGHAGGFHRGPGGFQRGPGGKFGPYMGPIGPWVLPPPYTGIVEPIVESFDPYMGPFAFQQPAMIQPAPPAPLMQQPAFIQQAPAFAAQTERRYVIDQASNNLSGAGAVEGGIGGVSAQANARVFVSGSGGQAPVTSGFVVSGRRFDQGQGTDGLQIEVDGQQQQAPPMGQPPFPMPMGQPPMGQMGQPQMPMQPPMGQPPMRQPFPQQPPMGQPPMDQPFPQQPPMGQPPMGQPPMPMPMDQQPLAGRPMTVKGFSRKTESFNESKSGSKTTTFEYEKMGSWDNDDYQERGGRFEQGKLLFSAPSAPVSIEVPSQQQALISTNSLGYQGRVQFYDQQGKEGICGYVPNVTNYVSLPMKYMPNACNRCVAIRSGNTFIKALVVEGQAQLPEKGLNLSSQLCGNLGVDSSAMLKVDWDFVPC